MAQYLYAVSFIVSYISTFPNLFLCYYLGLFKVLLSNLLVRLTSDGHRLICLLCLYYFLSFYGVYLTSGKLPVITSTGFINRLWLLGEFGAWWFPWSSLNLVVSLILAMVFAHIKYTWILSVYVYATFIYRREESTFPQRVKLVAEPTIRSFFHWCEYGKSFVGMPS